MKIHATRKQIKSQNRHVVGFDYCQIQYLVNRLDLEPTLYNANLYGWRCDYYRFSKNFGLVTGYATNGAETAHICDFNQKARETIGELEERARTLKWDDLEGVEELRLDFEQFLDGLANGDYEKAYCLRYNGKLWAMGKSKKEAIKDFYSCRSELVKRYKLDHNPKLKDCIWEIV